MATLVVLSCTLLGGLAASSAMEDLSGAALWCATSMPTDAPLPNSLREYGLSPVEDTSALFYCHHVTGTRIVQANLLASDVSVVNAVGVCHFDTSLWTSEHPAFKALHIPRGASAYHWLRQNDVVWMSAATQYHGGK